MKQTPLLLAPSMLAADFGQTRNEIQTVAKSGADWVHLDVMDGSFVPNISFGQQFIRSLRGDSDLPFDAHLMIEKPERYIAEFAEAGCDYLTVHAEASLHLHRTLQQIRDHKMKSGVSLIPSASVASISEVLDIVDLVLVMSVNPGFGGQALIPATLEKISELAAVREERNLDFLISVDGGVNLETIEAVASRGADVVVCGSAFFNSEDRASFIQEMHKIAGR